MIRLATATEARLDTPKLMALRAWLKAEIDKGHQPSIRAEIERRWPGLQLHRKEWLRENV